MRGIALIASLVLAAVGLGAGTTGGEAVFEVSRSSAAIGDAIDARLTVTPAPGDRVETAPIGPKIGEAAVLSGAWEPAVADGAGARVWVGRIAVYQVGRVTLPPVEVLVVGPEGSRTLRTGPLAIDVVSVLEGAGDGDTEPDLADLKPPASLPPDYRTLRLALAGLLALLAVAGAAAWIWRRVAPHLAAVEVPNDPFRRMPPHEWAYEELRALLERRLVEEGRIDVFHDELSRIVKQYLGGRYRVDLLEKTTSEVPGALRPAGAEDSAVRGVRALLEQADMVRFARSVVDGETCRRAVEEAYRIVDATKPAETTRGAA